MCALGQTIDGIPVVLNAVAGVGQEERIDFKVYGTEKVMSIRNWSELWAAKKDQPFTKLSLHSEPYSLLEACHKNVQGV